MAPHCHQCPQYQNHSDLIPTHHLRTRQDPHALASFLTSSFFRFLFRQRGSVSKLIFRVSLGAKLNTAIFSCVASPFICIFTEGLFIFIWYELICVVWNLIYKIGLSSAHRGPSRSGSLFNLFYLDCWIINFLEQAPVSTSA